jgi:osmotically-inducible protein OsmY
VSLLRGLVRFPEPIRRYLRFMGVVGRPRVWSFRWHWKGRFRRTPDEPFKRCEAWQYNTCVEITRICKLRIHMGALLPVVALDTYVRGHGRMKAKLLGVVPVADESGSELDTGELVTYLNDGLLVAPSMLLGPEIRWSAVDDRSLEQQAADLELKTQVEKALLQQNADLAALVNVDVYLDRVMLTGVVPSWNSRRAAIDIARQAAAGYEVYDDIQVATGEGVADAATNYAANKELGINLLADEGLASQSFVHRVVNGTAFIMGQAKQESQVQQARQVALQTPGITNVVTHILLRP